MAIGMRGTWKMTWWLGEENIVIKFEEFNVF